MKTSSITVVMGGVIVSALVTFAFSASTWASAQIKEDPRGDKNAPLFGVDWTKGDAPRQGEPREDADKRLLAYKPDPVKNPVPRTKWDGKPDFSGVYWPGTTVVERPRVPLESLYRPEVMPLRERTDMVDWRNGFSRPAFQCWPSDMIDGNTGGAVATQVVHAPGVIVIFAEAGFFRIIPTDGRPRNPARKPSYMGDSVGRWEGDTLVVEITNFKEGLWLGRPDAKSPPQTNSSALRIVEHWTRPDSTILERQAVIVEDPKMLTGPWRGPRLRMGRMPYDAVIEAEPCFEDPELVRLELEYQQGVGQNPN